jgi:hypothetical protein
VGPGLPGMRAPGRGRVPLRDPAAARLALLSRLPPPRPLPCLIPRRWPVPCRLAGRPGWELPIMLRRPNFRSLRGRLFVALFLTAAVPTGLLLVGGSPRSGRWWWEPGARALGRGGRVGPPPPGPGPGGPGGGPRLREAAQRHRTQLSESLRFSRLYAFLGDRILFLFPLVAGGLFVLAAGSPSGPRSRSPEVPLPTRARDRHLDRGPGTRGAPPRPGPGHGRTGNPRGAASLRRALRAMEAELAGPGPGNSGRPGTGAGPRWPEGSPTISRTPHPHADGCPNGRSLPRPRGSQAGQVLLEEIARLDELSRSFAQFGRPPEGPPSAVELGDSWSTWAGASTRGASP